MPEPREAIWEDWGEIPSPVRYSDSANHVDLVSEPTNPDETECASISERRSRDELMMLRRASAVILFFVAMSAAPAWSQISRQDVASSSEAERLPTWTSPPDWIYESHPEIARLSGLDSAARTSVSTGRLMPGQVPLEELIEDPTGWDLQLQPQGSGSATIRDPQVRPSYYQDLSPLAPQVQQPATAPARKTPARRETTRQLFAGAAARSNLILIGGRRGRRTAADVVLGIEAAPRAASDVGSLLGKVSHGRGVTSRHRNEARSSLTRASEVPVSDSSRPLAHTGCRHELTWTRWSANWTRESSMM